MYTIERKPFGFKLTFGGTIDFAEMGRWVADAKKALAAQTEKFGVLVDMTQLKPLRPEVQSLMVEGQKEFKTRGMVRSAVGVPNAVIALQFKRLGQESGIYEWERYVDGSKGNGWEKAAEAWIVDGTDPDRK